MKTYKMYIHNCAYIGIHCYIPFKDSSSACKAWISTLEQKKDEKIWKYKDHNLFIAFKKKNRPKIYALRSQRL